MQVVDKKVKLKLIGLNGNAFALLGAFKRQAQREKWTPAEITLVIDKAMSGDYNELLRTLSAHCE